MRTLAMYILISLLFVGCVAHPPPKFAEEETLCLAAVETSDAVRRAACGENIEGVCAKSALAELRAKAIRHCILIQAAESCEEARECEE